MQNKILNYFGLTMFLRSRNCQRILIDSFSSRLRAVRDVIYFTAKYFYLPDFYLFNSFEKFLIVLNLGYNFYSYNFNYFIISKKPGLSFFWGFPGFYIRCLTTLSLFVLNPLLEITFDRNVFFFRPCRNSYDFILSIKNALNRFGSSFLFAKFEVLNLDFKFSWLFRNFPFDKKILYFWINNFSIFGKSLVSFNDCDLTFNVFTFLLFGLVLLGKTKLFLFNFQKSIN